MSDDNLIRLADVPRLKWLPSRRGGKRLHVATVHRWADSSRAIHLKTVSVGSTRCTSETWLNEFFERMTGKASSPQPARTPARRAREIATAEAELAAAGIA